MHARSTHGARTHGARTHGAHTHGARTHRAHTHGAHMEHARTRRHVEVQDVFERLLPALGRVTHTYTQW